ncbi:Uncharacterised protein [Serratia fonticola]|nr:Uncharacterised protein [Serratia fonticola]CAI0946303.1 Uncharacterised protein [Serratia fonticola]CAI1805814.1 Uncharacterised protein [Serratia fonticola]
MAKGYKSVHHVLEHLSTLSPVYTQGEGTDRVDLKIR